MLKYQIISNEMKRNISLTNTHNSDVWFKLIAKHLKSFRNLRERSFTTAKRFDILLLTLFILRVLLHN